MVAVAHPNGGDAMLFRFFDGKLHGFVTCDVAKPEIAVDNCRCVRFPDDFYNRAGANET